MAYPEYSISDISSGELNQGQLSREIREAASWSAPFLGINREGLDFETVFDGVLSGAEQTQVTDLVINHVPDPGFIPAALPCPLIRSVNSGWHYLTNPTPGYYTRFRQEKIRLFYGPIPNDKSAYLITVRDIGPLGKIKAWAYRYARVDGANDPVPESISGVVESDGSATIQQLTLPLNADNTGIHEIVIESGAKRSSHRAEYQYRITQIV